MAKNPNPYGPQALTVQEATNVAAQRKLLRSIPTCSTEDTSTAGDVLVLSTELENAVLQPGGCSKLEYVGLYNHKDTTCDVDIVFTAKQVELTDAISEAVGNSSTWTETLAKSSNFLGVARLDVSDTEVNLINGLFSGFGMNSQIETSGIYLQAEENVTSVYFSVIDRTGSIEFGANDLEFLFGVQY